MRHRGGLTIRSEEERARRRAQNAAIDLILERGHVAASCARCDAVGEFILEEEAEAWLLKLHPPLCPGQTVH